jgi:RNA polymerase sigma-70 factor (ECF subfamily)
LTSSDPPDDGPDFDRVYERFFAPVRAKCLRLLTSPQAADDVVQEVFVRLWQWTGRPRLDGPDGARTLLAWLYRTSTRLSIDALRARRAGGVHASTDDVPLLPCGADVEGAVAARKAIERLRGAVPDDEILAAVLCRVDGLAHPEAAFVLGTSERTVRRLLARFDERTLSLRKEFLP